MARVHTQSAFIRGRNIYNGWIIASEVLNVMKRRKECLIFKLNFEKAYDCVHCHFIFFFLRKIGLDERWISWITICILIALVSILVNGSPGPRFYMECGMRQGCPLSPLLFNLVAKAFSILVNQFQKKRWL